MTDPDPSHNLPPAPPRAFTQGAGLVFQWVGVLLFISMMFICCTSSLLSKDVATRGSLQKIGWHLPSDAPETPTYTAQLAITLSVTLGVFFGIALAGIGLGLQAQNPRTPLIAVTTATLAVVFWAVQTVFFFTTEVSLILGFLCAILTLLFVGMLALALAARSDMRRNPPPTGFETLPADYKIPYSHMHQDPPEVRLAAELEDRRRRLEIQQAELEALEKRLKRGMKQNGE